MRVRFAPSPTGSLHLGSLKTALYNYLFAKRGGGCFILRVEDTDSERNIPGCAVEHEETLNRYGLVPDESPLRGGPHAPYTQSERRALYKDKAEELMDRGNAYRCFCTPESLSQRLKAQNNHSNRSFPRRYDNHCRSLSTTEVKARLSNKEANVIRFKFDPGTVTFKDRAFDKECVFPVDENDFVMVKSNGLPTYHFACVVDDHTMEITDVIRGEDWFNATPKHIRLYEAFDWAQPTWTHLPLIMRTRKQKLSKREADSYLDYYEKEQGYLPLAVLNYLVRNGSGIRDYDPHRLYSLENLVEGFDPTLLTRRGLLIDSQRLDIYGRLAFCGEDIDSILLPAIRRFLHGRQIAPEHLESDYIRRVVNFLRQNEETFCKLSNLDQHFPYFFPSPNTTESLTPTAAQNIPPPHLAARYVGEMLATYPSGCTNEGLKVLAEKSASDGIDFKQLATLLRVAMLGVETGPPIMELLEFFTVDEGKTRLKKAIEGFTKLSESNRE